MNEFIIITDSCCDLSDEIAKELEIEVIPMIATIEGKDYYNYLDEREIKNDAFYQMMRDGKKAVTTMIVEGRYEEYFEKYLKEGKDILSISFSSALSGSYNASVTAANELKEKYPNQIILCADSLCASMGQGLLVTYCAKMKKDGKNINEIYKWIEENKTKVDHLFTVGDLNFLRRGGRLSFMMAILGTVLRVKPLLHVSLEGKLVQTGKTKGRRHSIDAIVQKMIETIENPENQLFYISHGDCIDDANYMKEQIHEHFPNNEIIIHYIGPVIGSHSGPDTLAVFFLGNDRTKEKN